MTEKDRERILKKLEISTVEISKSKAKSKKFLISAGIITKKGKLAKPYKNLCIPQDLG